MCSTSRRSDLTELRSCADFFNQGFSEAMLVRMHLVYSKSTGEFDQLEKQVTRVQRAAWQETPSTHRDRQVQGQG